jgi:two-component system phosphate regulon response regulator PhoB
MTIFIVEDNENVREAAAGYLRLEGFDVIEFGGIVPAEKAWLKKPPDLLILDVMLPDGDGFMFAKRIRQSSDVPLLFLTARSLESDRITGLELGADDYIVKPFSTRELVLRVKAVLKRNNQDYLEEEQENYLLSGVKLVIIESQHRAFLNNSNLPLTAAEWNILLFMSRHEGQVFSRYQLLERCLDSIAEGSERTIDTHVKNIRHKLGEKVWIETVRGFGYRFNGVKS